MTRLIVYFGFLLFPFPTLGQSKYWIIFKDKTASSLPAISAATIQNRAIHGLETLQETDLPINPDYLSQVAKISKIENCSRWLNATTARLTDSQKTQIEKLSFVEKTVAIDGHFYVASTEPTKKTMLAPVMTQVEAEVFKDKGLTGKGVTIGVIDAGFFEAPQNDFLKPLFSRLAILGKRDYVNPAHFSRFFTEAESYSDFHGTEVLTAISGLNPSENTQEGLATESQFYLARTDHGTREWRGEEDNWIAAMEWMDSLGVRVINTSLGYAKGFTNPTENYEPSQMNGHTSLISRAAQIAVEKKGILLIVSAGNEGEDTSWQLISTPADAEGVIAVGATNQKLWNKIGYSSIGPEFLSYLKPNVSCFSLYGTSLAAPVITGFAACLMQANPKLTNKELKIIIEKSAHLYPYGNNFIGYGVPLASRALALATGTELQEYSREIKTTENVISVKVGESGELVSVFHKKNKWHVLDQEAVKAKNGVLIIRRKANETFTTIDTKKEVIEVVWEK